MKRSLIALLGTAVFAAPAYAEEEEESPLSISLFADAHYAYSTTKNGGAQAGHRAYVNTNGFSMSWLGLDATYDEGGAWAVTTSLRFGTSVPEFDGTLAGGSVSDNEFSNLGLGSLFQAYGTWRPSDSVSIDIGQFGTIYGAEVAESWQNLNYTRGALYYLMQPFWHTGVRANVSLTDEMGLTLMVVNGINRPVDDSDEIPSVGVQFSYATDTAGIVVGYLGNFDEDSDDFANHFFDIVGTLALDPVNIVFNADLGTDDLDNMYYGLSLAAGLPVTDIFGIAGRVEYLADPDGTAAWGEGENNLITLTGTLEFKPAGDNLIIRWDNRFESSTDVDLFVDRDGEPTDTWFTSVLGVVVTSS